MTSPEPAARATAPAIFLLLYLPFGIASGYVAVTLAYQLAHAGASVGRVAALVALYYFPQTWKVVWAPAIDTTLTIKRWYAISAVATALIIAAIGLIGTGAAATGWLEGLVLLSSVGASILGMATESLMAHATSAQHKGRAGGWSQAGNLGGTGLGGGLGLWLAQHVGGWSAGVALALACLACCLALRALPEPSAPARAPHYLHSLAEVLKQLWSIVRSRTGQLALLVIFLPMGTGAASNLWAAVAADWRAGADLVALVDGVLSGLIAAVGCLVGGFLCDLMNRRASYAIFGTALAVCAIAMGLAPRTAAMFVLFVGLYAFFNGFVYAAFTGVTLETIGRGAAATKYNLMACLANIPITYMTVVDGLARGRWGSRGMLFTEAAIAIGAALLFALVASTAARRAPAHR